MLVDIVWRKPDGTVAIWLMNARGSAPTVILNAGAAPTGYAVFQP